jgi:hypothetical protein
VPITPFTKQNHSIPFVVVGNTTMQFMTTKTMNTDSWPMVDQGSSQSLAKVTVALKGSILITK